MHFDIKHLLNSNNISTSISQLIWVFASLLIGKLIAINVEPETFGRYNLEFGIVSFSLTLFISPVIQYYKTKVPILESSRNFLPLFFGYALLTTLLGSMISLILLYYNQNLLELKYVLIVTSYFLVYVSYTYIVGYLNVIGKIVTLAKFKIIKSLANVFAIAIGLYFIAGSAEVIWVALIVSFILPFLLFIKRRIHITRFKVPPKEFTERHSKELLKYSFPLILLSIASWTNNYADRYILDHFYSTYEVGIYNAGYSIGSKVFLSIIPLFTILLTPKIYSLPKNNYGEKKSNTLISRYLSIYAFIGFIIIIIIFFTKNIIGHILLAENYHESFMLIPWISIGYFFLTMSYIIHIKFYSFSKTNWLLYSSIFSAVINIGLNFLFIPKLGIFGSAISSSISFTMGFLFCLLFMQKRTMNTEFVL